MRSVEPSRSVAPELADDAARGIAGRRRRRLDRALRGPLLLVLDQFEEYFLYHGDAGAGLRSTRNWRRRCGAATTRPNFLLSIREDTLAKLDRFKGRVPGLLDNLLRHRAPRPRRRRARRSSCRSQRWNGLGGAGEEVEIEPALVEAVLDAGRDRKGARRRRGSGGRGKPADATRDRGAVPPARADAALGRRSGAGLARAAARDAPAARRRREDRPHPPRRALSALPRREQDVAARVFRLPRHAVGDEDRAPLPPTSPSTPTCRGTARAGRRGLRARHRILRPVGDGAIRDLPRRSDRAVLDWRRRFEENRSQGILARGIVLSAAAALVAIVMVAYLGQVLDRWEVRTVDARFSLRGARAPRDVALVSIDEKTFDALRLHWPFPRNLHGRVIDRLSRHGARAIVYDIQFTEQTNSKQDNALIGAVKRAGNVVLATTEIDLAGHTQIFGGDSVLRALHARPGNAILEVSSGGVIRRMRWGTSGGLNRNTGRPGAKLENLALVAAEVATGRRIRPAELHGSTEIDYAGPPGTIPTFSFSDVLRNRVPPAAFRGRIVIVGATAPSLQDLHPTPVGGLMSGAEIKANAVHTALQSFPLHRRTALDLALIALLGLTVPVASLRLGSIAIVFVSVLAAGLYALAVQLAFNHDILLPAIYPLLALVLTTTLVLGLRIRSAATRRSRS